MSGRAETSIANLENLWNLSRFHRIAARKGTVLSSEKCDINENVSILWG